VCGACFYRDKESRKRGIRVDEKGFYFAAEEREEFGISVALVWEPTEKDLQLSIMLGNYMLAVGFTF
jgi:hypothetical protein